MDRRIQRRRGALQAANKAEAEVQGARRKQPKDVISILYFDGSALTRECIASELAAMLPEYSVRSFSGVAEVEDEAGRPERIGLIVYNAHSLLIEDASVIRDLSLLQKTLSGIRIVILSGIETGENVIGAMRMGIVGYLTTSLPLKIVSEAMRFVLAGGTFIPVSVLPFTVRANPVQASELVGAVASGSFRFTPREIQILRHLWEGEQNKTIAHALGLTEGTVKVHIRHLMKKLRANNRTQVALITEQLFGESKPRSQPHKRTEKISRSSSQRRRR